MTETRKVDVFVEYSSEPAWLDPLEPLFSAQLGRRRIPLMLSAFGTPLKLP